MLFTTFRMEFWIKEAIRAFYCDGYLTSFTHSSSPLRLSFPFRAHKIILFAWHFLRSFFPFERWLFHSSLFRIRVQPMWTKNKNIGLYFHLFVHIVFKLKLIWLRLSLCTISCTHMCRMAVCCSILFRVQFSIWLAIFWRHQNCWCAQ